MKTLSEWLNQIEKLHPKPIDLSFLSLERVKTVARYLKLLPWAIPTITVAGTNGKGSCVALTAAILEEAGYKTGAYFSPHLVYFNERICINMHAVSDQVICDAFAQINHARQAISLTYFEFATLAALWIFKNLGVNFAVLEVGMGGRLDAVNIISADIAVIASIDLDHQEWLGDTRDQIALEKSGIFRSGKIAVCGDPNPPLSLIQTAKQLQTRLFLVNQHFFYTQEANKWHWRNATMRLNNLPLPSIYLANAATVLQIINLLRSTYQINEQAIMNGLKKVKLSGRYQRVNHKVLHIFDVAHNPHATQLLAKRLIAENISGKIGAVFSMLKDKDMRASIKPLAKIIHHWYVAPIDHDRAASLTKLYDALAANQIKAITLCDSLKEAYQKLFSNSSEQKDVIVIFGSFYTVAAVFLQYPFSNL